MGDLFRRVGVCLECRPGPGRQHAVGVVSPGRLGLRLVRHRRDGSDARHWRIAGGKDLQPSGRASGHGQSDAFVPVGRGVVHRFAGAVAELSDLAGIAADDRGDPDPRLHPRRKLDQPIGGRAMARAIGGAVWQQLCAESAGRAVAAWRCGHRTRLRILGRRRFADGGTVPVAGSQRRADQRSLQRDLQRLAGLLPWPAGDCLGGVAVRSVRSDDPDLVAGLLPASGLYDGNCVGDGQHGGGG